MTEKHLVPRWANHEIPREIVQRKDRRQEPIHAVEASKTELAISISVADLCEANSINLPMERWRKVDPLIPGYIQGEEMLVLRGDEVALILDKPGIRKQETAATTVQSIIVGTTDIVLLRDIAQ